MGLSGATNIVKNKDQEKFVYTGCGIAFYGKSEWSLGNYSTRNIVTFWADNIASSHAGNLKNDFLILGEGPTFVINESFSTSEKKFGINVIKAKKKFCLSFHYDADNSYLFINGKGICNLKLVIKIIVFHIDFVLEPYPTNLQFLIYVKSLLLEICMVFQLITNLLKNVIF